MFKKALFILLFLSSFIGFSQSLALSKDARISILTCGLGNETYSYFGHTAVRVSDPVNAIDLVYNYGAFDFRTPNFVAKFAKGDLQYFIITHPFSDFINDYTTEKRSVYEQELQIPLATKQKIFDNLNKALFSEERYYTYKFIDRNCTSMVVDVINKSIGENVITKKGDTTISYRSVLFPYFNGHFYDQLGTSIIFGTKVDQSADRIFLPFELKDSVEKIKFHNQPLVSSTKTLIEFAKETPKSWWNNIYSYIIILLLVIFAKNKIVDNIYFLILGLMGIFFVTMGFYSFHQELAMNYNVLLFSPLLLVLILFSIFKNKLWTYRFSLINFVLLVIYFLFLINKAHFFITLPLIITSGVVLVRTAIRNKKPIPIII